MCSPLESRPPSVAPCLLAEWRLKHEDKKQRRPCLVLIQLFKNRHRHPLLPQTQRINTALVKVDPLKFTLWGTRLRVPPGLAQRVGTSLQPCATSLNLTLLFLSVHYSFCFLCFYNVMLVCFHQKSAQYFKRPLNKTTRGSRNLFQPLERIKTVCMSLSRQAMLGNIKTILLFVITVTPN